MNPMKILFLDILGVVNHQEFYERRENDKTLKSLPFIRTSELTGLTSKLMEKAIKILNK